MHICSLFCLDSNLHSITVKSHWKYFLISFINSYTLNCRMSLWDFALVEFLTKWRPVIHMYWLCFTNRTHITSIGSCPPIIFTKHISIVGCGWNIDKFSAAGQLTVILSSTAIQSIVGTNFLNTRKLASKKNKLLAHKDKAQVHSKARKKIL